MSMRFIGKQTVAAGGASSVTFSGIPQTATNLVIFGLARKTISSGNMGFALNGSSTGFTTLIMQQYSANNISPYRTTTNTDLGYIQFAEDDANLFAHNKYEIFNYAAAVNKGFLITSGNSKTSNYTVKRYQTGIWANTAAITSITFQAANFAAGTTFALYTITSGSGLAAVS